MPDYGPGRLRKPVKRGPQVTPTPASASDLRARQFFQGGSRPGEPTASPTPIATSTPQPGMFDAAKNFLSKWDLLMKTLRP